jgi:uncharacterized membrane protein YbjE (DUF340 family)
MMGLVNNAQENLQKELVSFLLIKCLLFLIVEVLNFVCLFGTLKNKINALYKEELYDELLKESDEIATKRKVPF